MQKNYGHYYCNACYPLECTNKTLIDKAEYRAIKWACKTLISKDKLKKLYQKGYNNYEIAEELGVTEELVEKACNYYFNNQ